MFEQLLLQKTESKEIEEIWRGLALAQKLGLKPQISKYRRELAYLLHKGELERKGYVIVKWFDEIKIGKEKHRLYESDIKYFNEEKMPPNILEKIIEEKAKGNFDSYKVWYVGRMRDPLLIGVRYPTKSYLLKVYALLGVWGNDLDKLMGGVI